jgi:hypothetical protein
LSIIQFNPLNKGLNICPIHNQMKRIYVFLFINPNSNRQKIKLHFLCFFFYFLRNFFHLLGNFFHLLGNFNCFLNISPNTCLHYTFIDHLHNHFTYSHKFLLNLILFLNIIDLLRRFSFWRLDFGKLIRHMQFLRLHKNVLSFFVGPLYSNNNIIFLFYFLDIFK